MRKPLCHNPCLLYSQPGSLGCVPGEGSAFFRVMVIGEAPGHDENTRGRPFVGRAGQILDRVMELNGLKRDQLYITNTVKCIPLDKNSKVRQPTPDEIEQCRDVLKAEIDLIQPEVIVALGATATRWFFPDTKQITKMRGSIFMWNNIPVVITVHPAYFLHAKRDIKDKEAYIREFGNAVILCREEIQDFIEIFEPLQIWINKK